MFCVIGWGFPDGVSQYGSYTSSIHQFSYQHCYESQENAKTKERRVRALAPVKSHTFFILEPTGRIISG